jgi:hypothetical protein
MPMKGKLKKSPGIKLDTLVNWLFVERKPKNFLD